MSSCTPVFHLPSDSQSNQKDLWVNDSPMTCMERLVGQAQIIKAINPDTKIWVYREAVAAQPWYSDVREKLLDPSKQDWFLKVLQKHVSKYDAPLAISSTPQRRGSTRCHSATTIGTRRAALTSTTTRSSFLLPATVTTTSFSYSSDRRGAARYRPRTPRREHAPRSERWAQP